MLRKSSCLVGVLRQDWLTAWLVSMIRQDKKIVGLWPHSPRPCKSNMP